MVNDFKKKEAYQQAFHHFDPHQIAQMRDEDIDALMVFPNIVHHRPKLEAIVAQAKGYIQIEQDYDSFSSFLWSFVDGAPIDFKYQSVEERITVNDTAITLSKALKNMVLNLLVLLLHFHLWKLPAFITAI